MKKYIGLIMVAVGVVLLVLAAIFGFKKEKAEVIAEGAKFNYSVTYAVNGSVVDTSTYFMTVDSETQVAGKDCYLVGLSVQNQNASKSGAARMARSANGTVDTFVTSGQMWYLKDTFDLAKKVPVSTVYGNTISTALTYTYDGSHGAPWAVGETWNFSTNVSSTSGTTWQYSSSAKVAAEEDVTVPAGTFKCYRIEYTPSSSSQPTLIEWWSDDAGLFVKMVDYGNYIGVETRELSSQALGE